MFAATSAIECPASQPELDTPFQMMLLAWMQNVECALSFRFCKHDGQTRENTVCSDRLSNACTVSTWLHQMQGTARNTIDIMAQRACNAASALHAALSSSAGS